jgi:hypothetical protein
MDIPARPWSHHYALYTAFKKLVNNRRVTFTGSLSIVASRRSGTVLQMPALEHEFTHGEGLA